MTKTIQVIGIDGGIRSVDVDYEGLSGMWHTIGGLKTAYLCDEAASELEGRTLYRMVRYPLQDTLRNAAAALGRKGGSVKSKAKKKSSAENGKRGGRPHKKNP